MCIYIYTSQSQYIYKYIRKRIKELTLPNHTEKDAGKVELDNALGDATKYRKKLKHVIPKNQKDKTWNSKQRQITKILLEIMKKDQEVIVGTKITGDQIGRSKLIFLSFMNMFKNHGLVDMLDTISKNDGTAVKKQLVTTALFVTARELLGKVCTKAASATDNLTKCEEQREFVTNRVSDLLPVSKDIKENIVRNQNWEQMKKEIAKIILRLRVNLPEKFSKMKDKEILDKLLGSEKKEKEEKEEKERMQQQDRDKDKCAWSIQLQIPCGEDCFFRNIHGQAGITRVQLVNQWREEVIQCCYNDKCRSRACDKANQNRETNRPLHSQLLYNQKYDDDFSSKYCLAYLAGMECTRDKHIKHEVPLCEQYSYNGHCHWGTACRRLHKHTASDGKISLQYTIITEFVRTLFNELGELHKIVQRQTIPGRWEKGVEISLFKEEKHVKNAIQGTAHTVVVQMSTSSTSSTPTVRPVEERRYSRSAPTVSPVETKTRTPPAPKSPTKTLFTTSKGMNVENSNKRSRSVDKDKADATKDNKRNKAERSSRGQEADTRSRIPKKVDPPKQTLSKLQTFSKRVHSRKFGTVGILIDQIKRTLEDYQVERNGTDTQLSIIWKWVYVAPPIQGSQGVEVCVLTQKHENGKVKITLSPDHVIRMLAVHTMLIDQATHSKDQDGLTLKPIAYENEGELKELRAQNQWSKVYLSNEHTFKCWFCYNTQEVVNVTGAKLKDLQTLTSIPVDEVKICKDGCKNVVESVLEDE